MALRDVKIKSSKIGATAVNSQGEVTPRKVLRIVSFTIYYKEMDKESKELDFSLFQHPVKLAFVNENYFGTISNKILSLWHESGELIITIAQPKGKIIGVYNDWFITQQQKTKTVIAYDKFGNISAQGVLKEDNTIHLSNSKSEI